jgi:protein TonB
VEEVVEIFPPPILGGGIGSGSGGGVGAGSWQRRRPGKRGGIGGGVFKVGGGISAPQPVSTPDPEYTEEARRAKSQGTCIFWLIVDAEGHPRDIRVVRGLGFGLDTKASRSGTTMALSASDERW